METLPQPLNIIERFNRWIQESIMVKLFSIGFLILILLIPSSWIENMIVERQQRAEQVIKEVADKWSGSQRISGPILVVPYRKRDVIDLGKGEKEIREYVERAYFLPEQLTINGAIKPQVLHRGIFDAVVYESSLDIKSSFTPPDFKRLSIADDMILWNDAHMVFGITDLRGISENPTFRVGDKTLDAEPAGDIWLSPIVSPRDGSDGSVQQQKQYGSYPPSGITVKLNWKGSPNAIENITVKLDLKGSRRFDFVPAGKTTEVKLAGPWSDPSFDGEFLPEDRKISDKGFTASWKVLHFNRPFAQQWVENNQELSGADFGINLLIPVDQYQKSIRTSKYGVLVILLTFVALFLVEITQKIRIHPFQYILIGAALTIYYTLLLSFSEHVGYNSAYMIASFATVLLISLYSISFFQNSKLTVLFFLLLIVFYAFIFVIILQQDYSLLLGSVGLFLIVGLLMYFSRKVSWYR